MTNGTEDLKTKLIAAKARVRIATLGALARKYDPNQPRVPRGHSDGGQWTDGGGGNGTSGNPDRARLRGSGIHRQERQGSNTGSPTWNATDLPNGGDPTIRREAVTASDGTKLFREVRNEHAALREREEFHLVRLPAGDTFGIALKDGTQTIYDSEGRILARTTWTDHGPQSAPVVQLAFAGPLTPILVEKTIEAVLLLGAYLASKDGRQPFFAFKAEKFEPGDTLQIFPVWTGGVSEDETRRACPKYDIAQKITDEAAGSFNPKDFKRPSEYGTAVHSAARDKIRKFNDPNLVAEKSILKSSAVDTEYGTKGSIRIDILEDAGYNIICVYDIKTGKSGLTSARIKEIGQTVYRRFGTGHVIIIIEMRPSRFRR